MFFCHWIAGMCSAGAAGEAELPQCSLWKSTAATLPASDVTRVTYAGGHHVTPMSLPTVHNMMILFLKITVTDGVTLHTRCHPTNVLLQWLSLLAWDSLFRGTICPGLTRCDPPNRAAFIRLGPFLCH